MKRLEILVDSDKTAESLLALIMSSAVAEMLIRIDGQIVGAAVVDADAGLEEENEDGEDDDDEAA